MAHALVERLELFPMSRTRTAVLVPSDPVVEPGAPHVSHEKHRHESSYYKKRHRKVTAPVSKVADEVSQEAVVEKHPFHNRIFVILSRRLLKTKEKFSVVVFVPYGMGKDEPKIYFPSQINDSEDVNAQTHAVAKVNAQLGAVMSLAELVDRSVIDEDDTRVVLVKGYVGSLNHRRTHKRINEIFYTPLEVVISKRLLQRLSSKGVHALRVALRVASTDPAFQGVLDQLEE